MDNEGSESGRNNSLLTVAESKLLAAYRDPAGWYSQLSPQKKVLVQLWLATRDYNLGLYLLRELVGEQVEASFEIATPKGSNQFALVFR